MPLAPRNLDVIHGFPIAAYQEIESLIDAAVDPKPDAYWDFVGGWSALAYRMVAAWEYDAAFRQSIERNDAPPEPERYSQERDIYGFFASGMSAIESSTYALFAMGTMLSPINFPLATEADRRRITPRVTLAAFQGWQPRSSSLEILTDALSSVLTDAQFQQCLAARNVLLHRTAPGRTIHVQVGSSTGRDGSTWKFGEFALDRVTLTARDWFLGAIRTLMEATHQFARDQFVADQP